MTIVRKKWLSKKEAYQYLGISKTAFETKVRNQTLPQPNRVLGERLPRWHIAELDRIMIDADTRNQPTN